MGYIPPGMKKASARTGQPITNKTMGLSKKTSDQNRQNRHLHVKNKNKMRRMSKP